MPKLGARIASRLLGVALIVAAPLRAQTPATPDAPRLLHVDASALRPVQLTYQQTLERDAATTNVGTRTVSLSQAQYAGAPAWLMLETRPDNGIPAVDSLFADLTGLRPIHWGATLGRARVSAEFKGDTAYAGTMGPTGRRSMIIATPPGTLINAAMLETVLRLLPLQTAWADSSTTLTVTPGGATTLPTSISVIGDDNVRVPAGQFDCWIVSVRAGEGARGLYWVSKRDPLIVRSTLDVPTLGGAQLVSVLTRVVR